MSIVYIYILYGAKCYEGYYLNYDDDSIKVNFPPHYRLLLIFDSIILLINPGVYKCISINNNENVHFVKKIYIYVVL